MDASKCRFICFTIVAVKMQGLDALVNCLRDMQLSYYSGLQQAILFTTATANSSKCVTALRSGFSLGGTPLRSYR